MKDVPFAHQLDLRAAGRISDYSTVGGTTTWSVGGDWAPIEDVRFRVTRAKAVRAPNIGELFTGPTQTFPTGLTDPCVGVGATGDPAGAPAGTGDRCRADPGVARNIAANGTFTLQQSDRQGVSGFTSGNPNLGPETANSFTAGVVINPKSFAPLRNFVLSVDYWRIRIADAVTFPSRQTILNECYQSGNSALCSFITRYPVQTGGSSPGAIQFVNTNGINASTLKVAGIDAVLQYRGNMGWLMDGLTANARIAYTRFLKGFVVPLPGLAKDPFAGEIGQPKNKANGSIDLRTNKWDLSFTGTYIGKACEEDQFLASAGLAPCSIKIDPEFYLDTQLSFTPIRNYEFFVGADNLLDNKAPNILSGTPFNITGADTAADIYDIFGRRFYAGVRLRF